MPTIKYPKNPNTDTAFVEQDDGTQNRALMIAPQDISTLELPNNPNSTKGYITVNGKKQRVILTADITGGGGGGSSLPDQTGHSGEFLTTDGTDASWAAINALQNTATGTNSLTIAGTAATQDRGTNVGFLSQAGSSGTAYGTAAQATGQESTAVGDAARATKSLAVAIGRVSEASGTRSIAILGKATAQNAIQIGGAVSGFSNTTADTFKVANGNGNFEMMSADGTIPTARLTKVNSTVTLAAASWSGGAQTVTVNGVTATGIVFVNPDPSDQADYTSAGIMCTAQAANSLTFTATTTPTNDIDVVVVML